MYAIVLNYIAPLDRIDAAISAHVAWLDQNYAAGHFLASGRREPRTGGVILAADIPADTLATLIAADPFAQLGLARHEIICFHPSKHAHALSSLKHLFS